MVDRIVVDRVFCYSKEEAKKNGNDLSLGKFLLQIFLIVIVMIIPIFFIPMNDIFILIYTFIFIGVVIFYAIKSRGKFQAQLTGFATVNKNIYLATKINNGEDFIIGGMAAGSILENINQHLGDAVKGAGSVAGLYALNKSIKVMQNPEIIAKMIEYSGNTTGAVIKKILKIHNYKENTKNIEITCDYMIMGNAKIKQNKKIKIYKSYNYMNDLLNLIKGGNL